MSEFDYAFFAGRLVKLEEAKVSIMTSALQYGTGIFAGIRGYYDETKSSLSVFRIRDHYRRFLSSVKILGCSLAYTEDELIEIHMELIKKNNPHGNVYFRPFAYVGSTNIGPKLTDPGVNLDFALYMVSLGDYLPVDKGLSVMVSSWRRVSDNAIPARGKFSGAYINSALAKKEAIDNGFDEAILLSDSGHVSEGSVENIFIVRDGMLITPCSSDDILEGITRNTIMCIAEDLGMKVVERTIDRSELYIADEIFLVGTGCQLAWVQSVDKRDIGVANGQIGTISKIIQQRYFATVYGEVEEYQKWCTNVKLCR